MKAVIDRATFLAQRREGLGGSDIAAILGVPGTYRGRGPYAVWLEKTGQAAQADDEEEDESSDLLELGNLLEPAILLWGARDAGAVLSPGRFARHPEHPWMLGNPDAWFHSPAWPDAQGAEAKLLVHKDDTTLPHEFQCRWYQAITGAERWHLVSLSLPERLPTEKVAALVRAQTPEQHLAVIAGIKGAEFRRQVIDLDFEVEAVLLERAAAWWQRHVVEGVPPDPDGSAEARQHLARAHANPGPQLVDAEDLGEFVREYVDAGADEKAAKARKDAASQRIQARIGDAAGARGSWGSVKWSRFNRSTLDAKALREARPDLAPVLDSFTRSTPTGRLFPNLKD